jgi:hypothetical protein
MIGERLATDWQKLELEIKILIYRNPIGLYKLFNNILYICLSISK